MRERKIEKLLIKSPKQMIMVIALFTMIIFVGGTTYAFFNYTRTGSANTLKTGRIYFSTEQTNNNTITLNNIFPMTKEQALADSSTNGQLVVTFEGDTTYTDGIEYLLTIEDFSRSANVPISLIMDVNVESRTVGDTPTITPVQENINYYTARDAKNASMYKKEGEDVTINSTNYKIITDARDGKYLLAGYIKSGTDVVNGTVTIKAFIDADNIIITDTPDNQSKAPNGYTDWTDTTGKRIISTTEWNNLQENGVTFKVKGEAREGIWVEEQFSANAMTKFPTSVITNSIKSNIKEIYFNKMSKENIDAAYNQATIKADITDNYEGNVRFWLEEDTVDNTKYIMYVASDGKTYFPADSSYLISQFSNLEKVEFNNVDTSRVTTLNHLLSYNSKLSSVDLSSFNMENVITMGSMLRNDSSLTTVDLSNLGSDNLTQVSYIVANCTNLKTLMMRNFNFGRIESLNQFVDSSNLETIDLSGSIMNNVKDMSRMFWNNTKLISINLSNITTPSVTNMGSMFENCSRLSSVDLSSGFGSDYLTNAYEMFYGCTSLTTVNMDNFNFGTTSGSPFYGASSVVNISLSNVKTSGVTDMSNMFYNCVSLKTLNLSSFNTNNVTNMYSMFYGCDSLVSLDLSSFNISSVTSLTSMFYNCSDLQTIYVGNQWNASGASWSGNMFYNCTSLIGGSGTAWNSSNPTDKTYAIIDGTNGNPGYLTLAS